MGKIYQLLPHFEVKEESDRKKKKEKNVIEKVINNVIRSKKNKLSKIV